LRTAVLLIVAEVSDVLMMDQRARKRECRFSCFSVFKVWSKTEHFHKAHCCSPAVPSSL